MLTSTKSSSSQTSTAMAWLTAQTPTTMVCATTVDLLEGGQEVLLPDTDGDNIPDYLDLDSDNDGISDLVEGRPVSLTDANNNGVADGPDADQDGIVDSADGNDALFGDAGDPLPVNTDGDKEANFQDEDSNNNGIPDLAQAGLSTLDVDNNGRVDGVTDVDQDGILALVDGNESLFGYLAARPNLLISKTGPTTATQNTNFTYTLVITNSGFLATSGVITVTDVLTTGLGFVSGSGFTCAASGQTVTCTSSTALAVNSTATLNLTVNPTTTGVKSNTASVVGGGDPIPANIQPRHHHGDCRTRTRLDDRASVNLRPTSSRAWRATCR